MTQLLTTQEKALVQHTFTQLLPIADVAADLFYKRLFEVAPQYRSMFTGDIKEQGEKLMQMIGVAVANMNSLEAIMPAIRGLGQRHATYGVQPKDYDIVGTTLLWTLEQGLGDAFTLEVHNAWANVYTLLANTMKEAAYMMPAFSHNNQYAVDIT